MQRVLWCKISSTYTMKWWLDSVLEGPHWKGYAQCFFNQQFFWQKNGRNDRIKPSYGCNFLILFARGTIALSV
jgi:hypothetical protein